MPTEMTEAQHREIDIDVHRLVFGGGVERGYEFVVPEYSKPNYVGVVIGFMCRKGFTLVVTPMRQSPSYAANFIGEPNPGTRMSYLYSHDVLEVAVCLSALKVAREHPGWRRGNEQSVLVSNGSNAWGGNNWVARQGTVSDFAFSGTVLSGEMVATHARSSMRGSVPIAPIGIAVYKNGLLESPLDFNTSTAGYRNDHGRPSAIRICHRDGVEAVVDVGESWSYEAPGGNRYVFTVAEHAIHPPDVRPIRLMTHDEERSLGIDNPIHYLGEGNMWRVTNDGRGIDRVDDNDKLVRHPSVGEGEET